MSKLQSKLSSYILGGKNDIKSCLKNSNGLEIYKKNYQQGLINTLIKRFPSVQKVLGLKNFNFFAYQFVLKNNSKTPNLDNYGELFPSFISSRIELEEHFYLESLCNIDLLWDMRFYDNLPKLFVLKGSVKLWSDIDKGNEIQLEINRSEFKSLLLIKKKAKFIIKENE